MRFFILVLLLIHFIGFAATAQTLTPSPSDAEKPSEVKALDAVAQEALSETQKVMQHPRAREEFLKSSPQARDVDVRINMMGGIDESKKQEMYDISSQITAKVAEMAGGDPAKMQKILEEAKRDPAAFYQKFFTDEQRARVKELAKSVEKNQKSTPTHVAPVK